MKRIQRLADIKELKGKGTIPLAYLNIIEEQFFDWFQAEGTGESMEDFQLGQEACIFHLEGEQDTDFIGNQLFLLEFVEYEKVGDVKYFRIGLMRNQEMSVVYFLEGTINQRMEDWAEEEELEEGYEEVEIEEVTENEQNEDLHVHHQTTSATFLIDGKPFRVKRQSKKPTFQESHTRITTYLENNPYSIVKILQEQKQIESITAFVNDSIKHYLMEKFQN